MVRNLKKGKFVITCNGSYRTSKLIVQGKYDGVNNEITSRRFPLKKHPPVIRTIRLVKFKYQQTSCKVLRWFKRHGFERPTYEDALYFGIQHPEEQRRYEIVFLHEPVQCSAGPFILILSSNFPNRRHLGLGYFWWDWSRHYVFAAVKKSRRKVNLLK